MTLPIDSTNTTTIVQQPAKVTAPPRGQYTVSNQLVIDNETRKLVAVGPNVYTFS